MPDRTRPLSLRVGGRDVFLPAADANELVAAIGESIASTRAGLERLPDTHDPKVSLSVIADLEQLRDAVATSAVGFADPPLEVRREDVYLLRQVLADISGYQRRDLTPGLRELRDALASF
jgi:hypothetical protein